MLFASGYLLPVSSSSFLVVVAVDVDGGCCQLLLHVLARALTDCRSSGGTGNMIPFHFSVPGRTKQHGMDRWK